ncbi:NAD-dependent formate dehydrogenase gamma subunit [Citreicella sp. SE45]|uniref:Formate dehydrogenase gamma subunit n=1 Tax=Salipiger thiooxidans TaxID=282683 RepID=A0A1G7LUV0_9RHOB|nr:MULTISPECIES: formate dehydrogenase subunit gamma [Salipiger]EEX14859.1 NAD-dependent formate dehydrogenase gamma subunit [Citreicella sp. SE45]NIY97133.1 formate dehydrogenase subunit gamma [Salipiger sp. HF18]NVK59934.1 formate dehydrogenase subunit gamma [Paracoccaceae bacterium]SDF53265.1 formate dehydrogenase gamma subunit [Salipiger thiooxidans]
MRHSKPTADEIQALIDGQMHLEGPLLPILHALQEAYDHVPEAALGMIAETLNLTKAEVHGVMSFYHDFRKAPAGRHVVKICRAEACQSMGANALSDAVLEKLGIGWGGTTSDGLVTVEAVYCLGLCACAPAAMVDDRLIARADAARLEKALEGAA